MRSSEQQRCIKHEKHTYMYLHKYEDNYQNCKYKYLGHKYKYMYT